MYFFIYIYGKKIPNYSTYIYKDVKIEDNVWIGWIGSRVIILGEKRFEKGVINQVWSVILNNKPKYGIAEGHPTKFFNYRNINHYEKLKREKNFTFTRNNS